MKLGVKTLDALCRAIEAGYIDDEVKVFERSRYNSPEEVAAFASVEKKLSSLLGRRVSFGRFETTNDRLWDAFVRRYREELTV